MTSDLGPDVRFVSVATPDVHGSLRGKTYARRDFDAARRRGSVRMTDVIYLVDAVDTPIVPPPFGVSETTHDLAMRLEPDTLCTLPWRQGRGLCLATPLWLSGEECELGPRVVLARVLERLGAAGLVVRAAFEYEVRLRDAATGSAVTESLSYSVTELARLDRLLDELQSACDALGIGLSAAHTEAGSGLIELNLEARDGVRAADEAILVRTALRELSGRQGLKVSFLAKTETHEEGSGGHLHLSVWRDGRPAFSENAALLQSAVAGLLEHLPALSLVYNPTINSFKRLVPGWFTPVNATWGHDNRSAAVRVIDADGPAAARAELRRPGADANPYLVLAAAAASVGDGITQRRTPPPPTPGDATAVGEDATPLPSSLESALAAFRAAPAVEELLGATFASFFADTRAWELAQWQRTVTAWERGRGERVP